MPARSHVSLWVLAALCACDAAPDDSRQADPSPTRVVRVLETRCACHGVSPRALVTLRAEPANEDLLRWAVDEAGRFDPADEVTLLGALAEDWTAALSSPLLSAPLAFAAGGRGDAHPEVFTTLTDPDYVASLVAALRAC